MPNARRASPRCPAGPARRPREPASPAFRLSQRARPSPPRAAPSRTREQTALPVHECEPVEMLDAPRRPHLGGIPPAVRSAGQPLVPEWIGAIENVFEEIAFGET